MSVSVADVGGKVGVSGPTSQRLQGNLRERSPPPRGVLAAVAALYVSVGSGARFGNRRGWTSRALDRGDLRGRMSYAELDIYARGETGVRR